jgi:hypothetical protein
MLQQQSLRSAVENSNRRMKIYDFLRKIHNTQLGPDIEDFIDIIAACANLRLQLAKDNLPTKILTSFDYDRRICEIISRNTPPPRVDPSPTPALTATQEQGKLLDNFLDTFPSNWDASMRAKQSRDLRNVHQSIALPDSLKKLLNFANAVRPTTPIPDMRAKALLDSNSVLLVQLGFEVLEIDPTQRILFSVITVQASERSIQHRV